MDSPNKASGAGRRLRDSGIRLLAVAPLLLAVGLVLLAAVRLEVLYERTNELLSFAFDLKPLFGAAHAALAGMPLYDLDAIAFAEFSAVFKLPPTAVVFVAPLAGLEPETATVVWRTAGVVGLVAAVALVAVALGSSWRRPRFWLAIGAVLLARPFARDFVDGQSNFILALATALNLILLIRSHHVWAGALVAPMAALKLFPVLLVIPLLARRDLRAMVGLVAGAASMIVLALFLTGIEPFVTWLSGVLPAIGGVTGWLDNQSMVGLLVRVFQPWAATMGLDAETRVGVEPIVLALAWAWTILIAGVSIGLLIRSSRRDRMVDRPRLVALEYSLAIAAILLVLPVAWIGYQLWLFIPFTVLFITRRTALGARSKLVQIAGGAAAVGVVGLMLANWDPIDTATTNNGDDYLGWLLAPLILLMTARDDQPLSWRGALPAVAASVSFALIAFGHPQPGGPSLWGHILENKNFVGVVALWFALVLELLRISGASSLSVSDAGQMDG